MVENPLERSDHVWYFNWFAHERSASRKSRGFECRQTIVVEPLLCFVKTQVEIIHRFPTVDIMFAGQKRSRKRKLVGVVRGGKRRTAPRRGRRSQLNGELKFHDVDLDDTAVAIGGTVTATINIIPQGVTESERIGRKCTIHSIGWRWNIQYPSQAVMASTSDSVRIMMYLDKQANGATIAVTDLLESDDYQSFNNLSNSGRFRVLFDRVVDMQQNATSGFSPIVTNEQDQNGTFFKNVNIPVEFSAGLGVIGEIRSNNLGVILLSRGGFTRFDSKIRLRFSDS